MAQTVVDREPTNGLSIMEPKQRVLLESQF